MKILQINKYITLNGGSETVMNNVSKILVQNGHEVINLGFEKDNQEYLENYRTLGPEGKSLKRFFIDNALVVEIMKVISDFKPDVVITHNVYHDFPHYQLVKNIERQGIRLVTYLHDAKPVCPAYLLFRDGRVCEECKGNHFTKCIKNRCKGSILKSAVLSFDSIYNIKHGKVYNLYDSVVSPSHFLKEKLNGMGLECSIDVMHNPIDFTIEIADNKKKIGKLLYAGRLSKEKGIKTIVETAEQLKNIEFRIAGDGPEYKSIKSSLKENSCMKLLGLVERTRLKELMRDSDYLVVPSIWYENNPMVILEAMSIGLPVIGARIGGIPELLEDGRGLLFEAGNSQDLRTVIENAYELSDEEYQSMIIKSKAFVSELTFDKYYKNLNNILKLKDLH